MLRAFRSSSRGKGTSLVVWGILGLLIVGLTGFGLGGAVSGLSSQNVASVGSEKVSREEFVRQLFQQIDAIGAQTGQRPTMQQAQLFGLDDQVLSVLVTEAALNGAAGEIGLSAGDALLREELVAEPAFQGGNGFDPQAYAYFLDRMGISAKEFEEDMRASAARGLLESGITGGAKMPEILAQTALAFDGERRSVRILTVTENQLAEPIGTPDEAALRAHYEANPDAYTIPETRRVTYAALTPEALAAEIEIPEDRVRAAYDAQPTRFNRPERRIVDVIAFANADEAAAAKAAIDAGSQSFEDIATARGLSAGDLSLGAIERESLPAAAREAVFAAEGPGVVGPVQSDLGPSLFRINAILGAQTTPFEDAADTLRAELAKAEAQTRVGEWVDPVFDLIAAGATLEEIADETPLTIGQIDLTAEIGEGLAADVAFRKEAFEVEAGDAPRDIVDLTGGGIAALRVDAIEPPALKPFEDVRAQVETDWAEAERARRLAARAEELAALLRTGRTMDAVAADAGLTPRAAGPLGRGDAPDGLPGGLADAAFELAAAGDSTVIAFPDAAHLVQLTEIIPVDTDSEDYKTRLANLTATLDAAFAQTLFLGYAQQVTDSAGVSVNQKLITDTLAQYP